MRKYLSTIIIIVGVGLLAVTVLSRKTRSLAAESESPQSSVEFDSDGKMKLPTGFRAWVFLGAPLTPEGLNDGKYNCDQPGGCTKSNFPEYHHVYVEKKNLDAWMQTGSFPEGTVLIKELTRVLDPKFPDGSRKEPSGRGYFNGEYNGIDVTVKDSKRFAETNNWGFFTFGHHPLPYADKAAESSAAECAGCHIANVADTDMTWIRFYPLLRDKKGY